MARKQKDMKYITEIKPGTYRISIRRDIGLDGKNHFYTKQISDATEDEAIALRDQMLEEVKELKKFDGTIKVKAFAKRWMEDYVFHKDAGTTIDDKWSKLNVHILPVLGEYKMEDVTSTIVQKFVNMLSKKKSQRRDPNGNEVPLSPTTVKNVYNILCAMFTYAASKNVKVIKESPCNSDIVLPKRKEEYKPEVYTVEEMDILVDNLFNENLSIQRRTEYILALCLGLRRGEIAGLKWTDIDFEDQTLYVDTSLSKSKAKGTEMKDPKTKYGKRPIGMNELVITALRQHEKEQQRLKEIYGKQWLDVPNVFTGDIGGVETLNGITSNWNRFVKRCGLKKVKLHGLRASFASYLSFKGIHGKELAELMGHSRSSTTEKYYTVTYPNHHKKIINITNEIGKDYTNLKR